MRYAWHEGTIPQTAAATAVMWHELITEIEKLQTCRGTAPHCPPVMCCICREMMATSYCSTDFQQATSFHPENWTKTSAWTRSSAPGPNFTKYNHVNNKIKQHFTNIHEHKCSYYIYSEVNMHLCTSTVHAYMVIGHSLLLARLPGTHWVTICTIPYLAQDCWTV